MGFRKLSKRADALQLRLAVSIKIARNGAQKGHILSFGRQQSCRTVITGKSDQNSLHRSSYCLHPDDGRIKAVGQCLSQAGCYPVTFCTGPSFLALLILTGDGSDEKLSWP